MKMEGGVLYHGGGGIPALRKDIFENLKTKEEGGTGLATEFWGWCEEQTKEYGGVGS